MTKKPKLTGRYICAWCGADLGPSGTIENSHGICPSCKKKHLKPYTTPQPRKRKPPSGRT